MVDEKSRIKITSLLCPFKGDILRRTGGGWGSRGLGVNINFKQWEIHKYHQKQAEHFF
jgi:hypothetical protein